MNICRHPFTAIKAAIFAVFLLGLTTLSHAASPRISPAGSWLIYDKPCAIFQQGAILLVVNEKGDLATAILDDAKTFTIKSGDEWDIGLVGKLVDGGRTIQWANGTFWTRAK